MTSNTVRVRVRMNNDWKLEETKQTVDEWMDGCGWTDWSGWTDCGHWRCVHVTYVLFCVLGPITEELHRLLMILLQESHKPLVKVSVKSLLLLFPPSSTGRERERLRGSCSLVPVSSRKLQRWKAIAGVKNFFSPSLQLVGINSSQLKRGRRGRRGCELWHKAI